jgi:hypothetical protein
MTGTAVAPASITITDGPTYNFGAKANGSVTEKTFTLTNAGAFAASSMGGSGLAAPYTFKGTTYPGTGGSCSTTLAPAGTCTIVVVYAPTVTGTHNDTIDIGYNNGASVQNSPRDITATSAPPATLAISDGPTYGYGVKATGSSTDKSFNVTNSGGVDATSVTAGGLAAPFTFKGGSYPGSGGTCGATIASSATCTIIVTYAPVGTGAHGDSIDFTFNDGVTASQTSARAVSGTGAAPAAITISDGSTYTYPDVANGGTADKAFTLTNSGGVPATSLAGSGLAAPFTFKGGGYPGTGGTCSTSLNATDTCTVVVTFAPTVSGAHADTLDITFNNGVSAGQTSSRDVAGTGVAPALLTITDGPTFDYGAVVATGSADKTFTIQNTGSLAATTVGGSGLAAPFDFKGSAYPGSGGTCGTTINAGATCTVVVTFAPATTGPASDALDMTYNNGVSAQTSSRAIQGTGATAASITISNGPTYSFGTVAQGSSTDRTFTLTNGGGVSASSMTGGGLAAPYSFKGGSYPGTGGTCLTSLAAAANCTIVVNYNPSTINTHTDSIEIDYNNGLIAQQATRAMTGTAVAPANITISDGGTYDFGTWATGSTRDKTLTLTNAGDFAASSIAGQGLAAPFTFKNGSFPGTGGTCTATLNPAATCTVIITYAPTATGTQSDTVEITYNNGATPQQSDRPVQGTGAAPATLTISDGATFSYGTVAQGSFTDKSFTVTNSGGVSATGMSGSGLAAPYSFKGGGFPGTGGTCTGGTLAASNTCTIVVTYNPTTVNTHTDTIELDYTDGVVAQQTTRALTGTSVAPANITISDGPTYNFGAKANGSTTEKTMTLTNAGSFIATTMGGTGLAAPYTFKGGTYPGTGGSCSTTLAAAGTCTVVLVYAPTSTGTHNDTMDIGYNNGASVQNSPRDLTGTSAPPATLAISDGPTYNYGTRATGSTIDKTFTVDNTGGVDATSVTAAGIAAPFTFKGGGGYPGTGGTCGATIASSASCTIVVTYAPSGTGAHSDAIDFTYNDGVTASQTGSRAVAGTGAAPAAITISDGATYTFPDVANGGTADKTFTLTNSGGVNATSLSGSGLAAPFTFKGGSFPGGGTCTASLAPTVSCTVIVTFAPTVSGAHSDTMDITFNNGVAGGQTSSRPVAGTGVAPALLTITDGPAFDYGAVVATGSSDKTFTITNTGSLAATTVGGSGLAAPFTFKGGGGYPGNGGTCGSTINAGATCSVVVTFAPATTGAAADTMDLTYNNGVSAQTSSRDVQGTGATAASITISNGATYSFGTVAQGSSTDKSFTLTNGGGVSATGLSGGGLAAPYAFKGGSYPGTGGSCLTTLAAAATCTIVVTYTPSTINTHTDTIEIDYNDGLASQQATRAMTGTAVAPASITLSDGGTYDFGTWATGSTREKTITLTNGGSFTASGMSGGGLAAPFTFKGGSGYPGTGGNCSTSLAPAGTCTIVVVYAPTATGTQTDTVEISYNDGANAQQATRPLQGTGAAPATLTISDGVTFSFGTVANGSTTDKTFTITNSGGVSATGMSGSGLAAPYSFKGGGYPGTGGTCIGGTLAGGGTTCTIVVTFAPSTSGTHTDTIDIAYTDGVNAQTSSRDITGISVGPANITISDGTTYNFGAKANGSTTEKTFTLTNSGGFGASGMGGSGLAAPYTFKGAGYPGTGGSCSTTLAASGTCTVVVVYAPTATGTHNDTMDIAYNNGASAQTSSRDMTGTSAPPAVLAISDGATFDYQTRATGSSTDKTFTIDNTGGVDALTVTAAGLAAPFTFKGTGTYPGTGGTCGATIASAASCTIVVTYAPTGTGAHSDSIDFTYNDGVTASQTSARAVQGTGAAPAAITISDGSTYTFPNVANGGSTDKTFTLTNSGGVPATALSGAGLAAPFTFKGGSFPGGTGTCSGPLAAGATCTVVVTFAPTVSGAHTDTMDITFNNGVAGGQISSRDVAGTGVAPALLTITDGPTFDYGAVVATGSSDKTFTIQNTGSLAASTVTGTGLAAPFSFKGGGGFPGSGGTCGGTINPGATCTIIVTFAPASTGPAADTIDLNYNNGVSAQISSRDVQGTGATAASITISNGATYNFGTVANGSNSEHVFTLTNGGGVTATGMTGGGLAAPYTFKGGSYPGTGGTCTGGTLAASATCTVVVSYNPSTVNTHTDTIEIDYNNGLITQQATRALTGTAVAPASITISDGATYDFGTLATGATAEKTFTLTNGGSFSASLVTGGGLAAPFIFKGGGGFPGAGGNCSTSLAASGTCTIVVTYSPSATGTQTDTIEIGYYDGANSQQATRAIQGTGAAPALLALSDGPTYNFGTKATGSTTDKTITITNSGGVTATGMSGSGLAAPFTFKGGGFPGTGGTCTGGTLAGGNTTCTIVVTYTPSTTGAHSDTIDIAYNNGASAQTSSRDVAGTGATPANLTISDGPTYDFGALVTAAVAEKTLTITNSGGVTATVMGGSGLAAPFTFKGVSGYPGTGGTCGTSLGAGLTCTIVVRFSPASDGSYNDTIDIAFNDGAGSQTSSRDVSGVGAPPASLSISDGATYNFGTIAQGGTADKTFTITNNGGVTATALAGTGLAAPYSFKGGSFPGGGSCGTSLASTASCTIIVSYNPSATGTLGDTIEINYTDGLDPQTATRAVTGTAVTPATITISDATTYNFGTFPTGTVHEKTFTLTHTGAFPASGIGGAGLAAPFVFKGGGGFPGTGGSCTNTLSVAATCTIIVTYSPTATGTQTDTIEINYNNGASAQQATRDIQGTGAAPALLTLSDGPTYSFGGKANGSSTEKTMIITNSGGVTATSMSGGGLAAPYTFKGGGFPGTGGSCTGGTLAASATCTIVVVFAPPSTNTYNDTIEIGYHDGANTQQATRDLTGSSTAPATLSISDGPTYDYGTIITNSSADKSITITNTGNFTASTIAGSGLATPFIFKGGTGFPGSGGNCGTTLAPAGTCTVVVTFTPTVSTSYNDTMDITYNDGVTGQISSRDVAGAGGPAAQITISDGATYNFSTVAQGSSTEKVFTLNNIGGASATSMAGTGLAAPYSFKGGGYPGTGGSCNATLTGSSSCTIIVVFSPSTITTHTDTIEINYNDGAVGQQSTRPLTGTAVAPASLSVSDGPTYDFSVQPLTKVTEKTFTITNNGGFSASSLTGTGITAPFVFKGGGAFPGAGGTCGNSLAPAASCTMIVTYTPTTTGAHSGTVDVNYNNGASAQVVQAGVQGMGATVALLAVSDGATYNFGTRAVGLTAEKTFTVSNSGGVTATSLAGGGLAPPFTFKGGNYPGTGGDCNTTLAPASSCNIVVVFTPSLAGGASDTIEIGYSNGLSAQSADRAITGTGADPATLSISDGPTYDFTSIQTGFTADKTFTVTNTGRRIRYERERKWFGRTVLVQGSHGLPRHGRNLRILDRSRKPVHDGRHLRAA